ncbi:hypothetical protein LBMAG18_09810 [Alphaproteobacteria bacterium]|nr:hypothetical protein LBMAG18_09810 [Alphaproteobacteria bacterium]
MTNSTTQTQDGITGHLATETDLASYDFAKQQLNAMQTPTFSEIGSWVSSVFTFGESDKIPDQLTVDNSQLNLDIRTNLTSNFLGNNNITQTGNIIGDGDWEVSAPINNLNGDGYKNVAPYGIVSDQFRPGNSELSQYANFNTELRVDFSRLDNLMNKQSSQQLNFQLQNPLANLTNNFINARTFLNIDPVVLDLNGDGVKLTSYNNSEVTFDVDNDGKAERTGWVSKEDGILVEDQNNNGKIDNITETISEYYKLQGSNWTKDGEGKYSSDGLAALKKLDSNNDGKFNSSDAKWNDLRIWVDANGDAQTDSSELKTLTEAGIKEINVLLARILQETNILLKNFSIIPIIEKSLKSGNREYCGTIASSNPEGLLIVEKLQDSKLQVSKTYMKYCFKNVKKDFKRNGAFSI